MSKVTLKIPVLGAKKQENNRKPKNMWKPGQSGNPDGRPPKGYSITEMVRTQLTNKQGLRNDLVNKIFDLALKGDVTMIKTIWVFMDGAPKETIDMNPSDNEQFGKLKEIVVGMGNAIRARLATEGHIKS